MKGIILAAGNGTRLYPASHPISKILLPIYDKPMIYYPLSTLMLAGVKDILIITNEKDIDNFKKVLGNGNHLGLNIQYEIQYIQRGIADAFLIAEKFINNDSVVLILGDNIFHGHNFADLMKKAIQNNTGATVFGYKVPDPERFGVVEFDKNKNAISLEEKPKNPKSQYAVTGLYFYDSNVCKYAKDLTPSARGELEITDLNKIYLREKKLKVEILGQGYSWLDTGTYDAMLQASNFIQTMDINKNEKIACIEEIALQNNFIDKHSLKTYLKQYEKKSDYYNYVFDVINSNPENKENT